MTFVEATERQRLDRRLVHKHHDCNVVLCDDLTRVVDDQTTHSFRATLYVDTQQPFFFEHPRTHVPGMLILEAGRQMVLAVCHYFYDVPFDVEFMMSDFSIRFFRLANLHEPIVVESQTTDRTHRKGQLVALRHEGVLTQAGNSVAWMGGSTRICSNRTLERMERFFAPASTQGPGE